MEDFKVSTKIRLLLTLGKMEKINFNKRNLNKIHNSLNWNLTLYQKSKTLEAEGICNLIKSTFQCQLKNRNSCKERVTQVGWSRSLLIKKSYSCSKYKIQSN